VHVLAGQAGEPKPVEPRFGLFRSFVPFNFAEPQAGFDVGGDGAAAQQRALKDRGAQSSTVAFCARTAVEHDCPSGWFNEPSDRSQEGRFSGAVSTERGEHGSIRQRQVGHLENRSSAAVDGNVVQLDERVTHRAHRL
jgi:hypothetical protein